MYFHHIHPSSNSSRLHPQLPVHPTLRSPPHCVAQLLLGVVPALDRDQPARRQVIKASGLSSSRSYQMPMAPQLQSPLLPSVLGFCLAQDRAGLPTLSRSLAALCLENTETLSW